MKTVKINNRDARRLWLNAVGLAAQPTGKLDLLQLIKDLGFVQLDTIRNVTRAHHHILWTRNQNYREPMLNKLLAEDRAVFEHFTHDASVLPMEFYPMWQRQFRRLGEQTNNSNYYKNKLKGKKLTELISRIEREGPLSTQAFSTKTTGKKQMWERPPHKVSLDLLWYSGVLATSHRENFGKYYDLAERVFPDKVRNQIVDDADQIHWLCEQALERLAFATPGEIQRFWGAVSAKETKIWLAENESRFTKVEVECSDKRWYSAVAPADLIERLDAAKSANTRLRVLSPFDPAIRDRNRLMKLFGFDYRIEIFVPAAKRQWGYYVYPLLEGERFVGRVELKADRKKGVMSVVKLWSESGVNWTDNRAEKLDQELRRLARMVSISSVEWQCARTPGPPVKTS